MTFNTLLRCPSEGGAGHTTENEPHIIEGPDFSKITTIHGDPSLIDTESARITKLIQAGGNLAAARKGPVGWRKARLAGRRKMPVNVAKSQ